MRVQTQRTPHDPQDDAHVRVELLENAAQPLHADGILPTYTAG